MIRLSENIDSPCEYPVCADDDTITLAVHAQEIIPGQETNVSEITKSGIRTDLLVRCQCDIEVICWCDTEFPDQGERG